MTDVERVILGALASFAQSPVPVPKLCRCEVCRQQTVAALYQVPVPLSAHIPDADPECSFCQVVIAAFLWAIEATPNALDVLDHQLANGNPLVEALYDIAAGPVETLLQ